VFASNGYLSALHMIAKNIAQLKDHSRGLLRNMNRNDLYVKPARSQDQRPDGYRDYKDSYQAN